MTALRQASAWCSSSPPGLGAAIGGVAVNAAGLPRADSPDDIAFVAQMLFAVFAVIAALGIPLAQIVIRRDAARAAPNSAE